MFTRILTLLHNLSIEAVEQDSLTSLWAGIVPFPQSKAPNLTFKKTTEGQVCDFVCYGTGKTLTIMCCFQHTVFDRSLQQQAEMNALEGNEACISMGQLTRIDGKLTVMRGIRLFTPCYLQLDSLSTLLSTLQSELQTATHQLSLQQPILVIQPTQDDPDRPLTSEECVNKLRDFLSRTGFRNIKISVSGNATYLLIIAMIEEEEMPLAIRTFPIRFEVRRTEVTMRIYFSCNNSVATFPPRYSVTTLELAQQLTTLLASNYRYSYDSEKKQVHLVRSLQLTEVRRNSDHLFQSVYFEGIQTFKWSSEALYWHLLVPSDSWQSGFEKVCYKNPANRIYPPIQIKLPFLQYNLLIDFLRTAKYSCFLTLFSSSEPENSCQVVQKLPIDYISIREYAEKSPSDLSLTLQSALPLCFEAQKRGIPLAIDMFAINKANRELTVSLPGSGLLDSVEISVVRSLESVQKMLNRQEISSDPLNMRLKGENFRLIARVSQWILTGELCGLQVKLLFCPSQVLTHPHLSIYLQTLGNFDFIEDFLGIMDFEGCTYLVQRYFPSQALTLAGLKRLVDLLQALHRHRIYHGCLSLQTICMSSTRLSLLFPAFSPVFFPLVGTILSPDRLNYSLFLPLQPFLLYDIAPKDEDLEAADTAAVCLLALQCCFHELPSSEVAQELHAGTQGRASLAYIANVLQRA